MPTRQFIPAYFADNYILQVSGQVSPELRLLMLASAAGVDLALKQDEG